MDSKIVREDRRPENMSNGTVMIRDEKHRVKVIYGCDFCDTYVSYH